MVEQALRSFEAAELALDVDGLIRHFAHVSEFHIYNDGQRLSYEQMTAGVRTTFPMLHSIRGGFDDIEIIVIAPDAALSTATFHETITDRSGGSLQQRGAASWLWRLIDGEWRIVYGHLDHYPVAGDDRAQA